MIKTNMAIADLSHVLDDVVLPVNNDIVNFVYKMTTNTIRQTVLANTLLGILAWRIYRDYKRKMA